MCVCVCIPPTKTEISRPRESVTLEIPRLWPTIMADYYDKPKKLWATHRHSVVQTDVVSGPGQQIIHARPILE